MKRTKNLFRTKEQNSSSNSYDNNSKVGVRVYLDHAATTPVDPRVFKAMEPFFTEHFENPGSIHKEGVYAKGAVTKARNTIAKILDGHPDEMIFTSGGTESNNLAIRGVLNAVPKLHEKAHMVTSAIEHASVLDVFYKLEKSGITVSYIPVDKYGIIKIEELKKSLRPETVLVSVMYANNEIGTVQPIHDIAKIIRNFRKQQLSTHNLKSTAFPLFHTDASQAPAYLEIVISKLGVDLLTLDGQKIYGPKGIGLLYKRRGIVLEPMFYGGNQEFNLRPGTENVPGIVGFVEALKLVTQERGEEAKRLTALRDYFIEEVLKNIKDAELNGDRTERLPNNVNISFPGLESDWVVLQLDAAGIAVGSKSACLLGDEGGSYVISALHKSDAHARSSVRFTFGRNTTKKDIDYTLRVLTRIILNK